MKKQVFISYKRDDLGIYFTKELMRQLENYEFEVWLDSSKIPYGDNWRDEIDEGIRESFAVIVVLTPLATLSQYVTYEWSYALGLRKRVIPLILQKLDSPHEIHPKLEPLNYINFTEGRKPFDELINRLNEIWSLISQDDVDNNNIPNPIFTKLNDLYDKLSRKPTSHEILEALRGSHLETDEFAILSGKDMKYPS
ncbi:MAG: toll/interleukin-1 receptor domain-containing protein [bacterium]|nr:toll/interleukin-1 receptor domain-containing protein [bacterium]